MAPTGPAAPNRKAPDLSDKGKVPDRRRAARSGQPRRTIDPARRTAFEALRAVNGEGAYANLVLAALTAQHRLNERDAAFATELVFGTSRLQGSYDLVIERAGGRKLASLQPAVVDVLRLAAHQILGMRVPARAGVAASVDLAGAAIGERVTGVVNAISRRIAAHTLDGWLDQLTSGLPTAEALAIRHGHPRWIVDAYAELLDEDELVRALQANNIAPTPTLVVRPGLATVDELVQAGATPTVWSPWGAIRAGNPSDVAAVRERRAGVQDEGSQLVCLAATRAPVPAGPWLDLCAGPGGKAALLTGLAIERGALLVASDSQEHRARLVAKALAGYPGGRAQTICADGTRPAWRPVSFSLVLADVPCTGLGALRRRPESRWRHQASLVGELAELQRDLLRTALASVPSGGVVAYATCSPHRAETHDVVVEIAAQTGAEILDAPALLPEVPGCSAATDPRFIQLWPQRHGTDAMFLALLRPGP